MASPAFWRLIHYFLTETMLLAKRLPLAFFTLHTEGIEMLKSNRRWALALAWAVLLLPAAAAAADVTPFEVKIPTVVGPIASTPDNFGFGIEGFDVQPAVPEGYVIEEFFFSGTGNIYEFTPTG